MGGERETTNSTISNASDQSTSNGRLPSRLTDDSARTNSRNALHTVDEERKENNTHCHHCRCTRRAAVLAGAPGCGTKANTPASGMTHHRLAGSPECLEFFCHRGSAPGSPRPPSPGARLPGATHHPGLPDHHPSRRALAGASPAHSPPPLASLFHRLQDPQATVDR